MSDNKNYIVDGIKYPTDSEALKAVNELNGIKYVKARTDMSNPKLVLSIYNKMLDKKLFNTVSGYKFLMELKEVLDNSPEIDNSLIKPIEAPSFNGETFNDRKKKESPYKSRFINSVIINVLFAITIIAMVFITTNSKNLNILNYKNRLEEMYIDKENELAIWNNQLKEKESSINRREEEIKKEDETTDYNKDSNNQ